jgi:hypothetical protein
MQNVEKTIVSQYANSPILCQLIQNMNQYIDQTANFKAFYDFVWNVDTAQGFGLDVWGRIVDVGRTLKIPDTPIVFGFNSGINDFAPFGQAPFTSGENATSTYVLSDTAYRTLILLKALANISATTVPALNQLLNNLFQGRGRRYVNDLGGMSMRYTFEFTLQPFEAAIITQSGAFMHPAGVGVNYLQLVPPETFGFKEAITLAPFDNGAFFN